MINEKDARNALKGVFNALNDFKNEQIKSVKESIRKTKSPLMSISSDSFQNWKFTIRFQLSETGGLLAFFLLSKTVSNSIEKKTIYMDLAVCEDIICLQDYECQKRIYAEIMETMDSIFDNDFILSNINHTQ